MGLLNYAVKDRRFTRPRPVRDYVYNRLLPACRDGVDMFNEPFPYAQRLPAM